MVRVVIKYTNQQLLIFDLNNEMTHLMLWIDCEVILEVVKNIFQSVKCFFWVLLCVEARHSLYQSLKWSLKKDILLQLQVMYVSANHHYSQLNCEGCSSTGSAECIWRAPLAAAKRSWMIPEHTTKPDVFDLGKGQTKTPGALLLTNSVWVL